MTRTAVFAVALALAAVFAIGPAAPAASIFGRRANDSDVKDNGGRLGIFPDTGAVETLVRTSNILTYKNTKFQELYGTAGNRYIQYGMHNLMSGNYTYGPDAQPLNIEIANMPTPTAAAGLFHHHRGFVLKNTGKAVDVGAEGVIDTRRGGRNLYFYRGKQFVKIVYSGMGKAPSLLPIADFIDARMPKGRDERPDGFEYIDIEGVTQSSVTLTPGFTFTYSFLPPSVMASAPGGGSPASDMFIITRVIDTDAAELYKGYSTYLRLNAEYYEEYKRGRNSFVKAVDPKQGRVVFTAYRNCLIIAARPDGYEKGEVLIDRVMERIDERRGGGKSSGGEKKRRFGLFRRRTQSEEE